VIVGSVVDTQTVVTLTETAETVTFPIDNLTVVGIVSNGVYTKVPINNARNAVIPAYSGAFPTTGQLTAIEAPFRKLHFTINGTALSYSTFQKGTSVTTCFYYGTPLTGSRPFEQLAGITTKVTLSGGSGSGVFTFPSGQLEFTGFTAAFGLAAQSGVVQAAWATSPGITFNAFVIAAQVADEEFHDIIPLGVGKVSITLTVTLTLGTGADVVVMFGFYQ